MNIWLSFIKAICKFIFEQESYRQLRASQPLKLSEVCKQCHMWICIQVNESLLFLTSFSKLGVEFMTSLFLGRWVLFVHVLWCLSTPGFHVWYPFCDLSSMFHWCVGALAFHAWFHSDDSIYSWCT